MRKDAGLWTTADYGDLWNFGPGLSPVMIDTLMEVLARLRSNGLTMLLVEQNVRAAFKVADRVMVMDRGKVVAEGTPADLASDERVRAAYFGGSSISSSGIAGPKAQAAH